MQITLDEGYQFGLGLFETISVENGRPILLDWHLERLHASMEELGIGGPPFTDLTRSGSWSSVMREKVLDHLAGQPGDHHALKIMVSEKNCLFTLRPNPYTPEKTENGFRLAYSGVYRNETSLLVRHKTMNYGDCILEKRRAAALGVDELIFCNSRGEICEGTVTNIFFAKEGRIYTPPVSCGLLPGILRRFLMEQFPVEERALTRTDILQMEECFVTNSLMGVMPVTALDGKRFRPGAVTADCRRAYSVIVRE